MTAYGRAFLQTKKARWTVEVSSVNRKGLDIHLLLPPYLMFLDPSLRKWIGQNAQRGNITLRLTCEITDHTSLVVQLKKEKERWSAIAREIEIEDNPLTFSFLLTQITSDKFLLKEDIFEKECKKIWDLACKEWNNMKLQEGKALVHDILSRVKKIQKMTQSIQKEVPKIQQEHLRRLTARMKQFELETDIAQLKKEAVLQADREDVTEELIRLQSHVEQMKSYIRSKENSVGRTLDFLSQEMGREIGTLMAKAGSSAIARLGVIIKSEIEKIREQVQNIE